jgi:hypothetical protein
MESFYGWLQWDVALRLVKYPTMDAGCSSGVVRDNVKVSVEGSNPFARSSWC